MDSSRIKSIRAGNRAAVTKFFKKLDELNTDSEMDIDIAAPSYTLDSIRNFSDKSEVYILGLESLGQCQDTYGSLLIPVMLGKLPISVKSNITRENGNDDWTLGNLRKAIQREISIQEASTNENEACDIPTASFHAGIELLTRFRTQKFAVTTDIEKAFLQVGLHKSDRDVTRFFWLSDPTDSSSPFTTYRFKSVLFGATCSPFILNATLLKHFEENPSPTASRITQDLYVDKVLTSFTDEDDLMQFYRDSRCLLQKRGFNLRSWNSNSNRLRQLAKTENVLDSSNEVNILGMRWKVADDKLLFAEVDIDSTMSCYRGQVLNE
ncbi:Hypothetical predicted protein [Mytilus galloprovincialis]|uniref:Reverse transcriptase domain-containing protein n=1 Tax=Mytilus galloprovincialis TaxID=29158 RepID=A0A8B6GQA4_MYTGA|nr:Hypothetical predicted protein [Mytilus galloprovincialis]